MNGLLNILAQVPSEGLLAQPPNQLAGLLSQNMRYAQPASVMKGGYLTKLNPLQEMAFQQWVQKNGVPFDPSPTADYDMRGFYLAQMNGDGRARSGVNANDGRMHFSDTFKTPYHESFSAESKFSAPGAPHWNNLDQLVTPGGRIVFDERKRNNKE